jgi:hypothetical protein
MYKFFHTFKKLGYFIYAPYMHSHLRKMPCFTILMIQVAVNDGPERD